MSEAYLTVRLPFNACCNEARLLLSTARLFRLTVLKLHNIILEENPRIISLITLKRMYRKVLQEMLPNRRYVDGAITLVYSVYESAQVLGVLFNNIEFKNWLMFQQSEKEIHLSIPYSFYLENFKRHKRNYGEFYGGVDVNVDRINLAIVDKYGRLRDTKTFWFEEASWKVCSRQRAWSIIGMAIHDMLKYAYHHEVKTLYLENPETLGYLKTVWIKKGEGRNGNYNHRVQVFRSRTIERIVMKAPLYAINTGYVDPKGTTHSKEHDEMMRKYGLDKHTASAYLITLKGLKQP